MKRSTFYIIFAGLTAMTLLAACSGNSGPTQAIEGYVEALVAKDADRLATRSCAAWEAEAKTELQSFDAVGVRLEGLECQESGVDGEYTVVSCQGTIIATYGDEDRELELNAKDYLALEESGEWRMCGYH